MLTCHNSLHEVGTEGTRYPGNLSSNCIVLILFQILNDYGHLYSVPPAQLEIDSQHFWVHAGVRKCYANVYCTVPVSNLVSPVLVIDFPTAVPLQLVYNLPHLQQVHSYTPITVQPRHLSPDLKHLFFQFSVRDFNVGGQWRLPAGRGQSLEAGITVRHLESGTRVRGS